jgi:hypothetical protein
LLARCCGLTEHKAHKGRANNQHVSGDQKLYVNGQGEIVG